MQRLEVSGAVRPIYASLGFKGLYHYIFIFTVLHTTSCILQSNVPEDGHNYCPKHVELTMEF